jgi:hypothetical protein
LDRFDLYNIGKVADDAFTVKDARRALFKMDLEDKGFLNFEDFKNYLKLYDELP